MLENVNDFGYFSIDKQFEFLLSTVEHEKSFITSGPGYWF